MKSTLNIQLQGFPPANRDAEITLVNQATGQTLSATRSSTARSWCAISIRACGT